MGIILTKPNTPAVKLSPTTFAAETHLQSYIAANPECIPVDQIEDGLRLLILGREFPTASGPVDVLAMDAAGTLYLIETKLYKNPDKRKVVAQVLDYGAALWSAGGETVARQLASFTVAASSTPGPTLQQRIAATFDQADDEALETVAALQRNITAGRIRFLVLMDHLDDRLKDLILFINENSRFELLAVEIEYYKHDELEIVIPRLFGAHTRRTIDSATNPQWNAVTIAEAVAAADLKPEHAALARWGMDFASRLESAGLATISYGAGATPNLFLRGRADGTIRLGLARTPGKIHFVLHMHRWVGDQAKINKALEALSTALNTNISFQSGRMVCIADHLAKPNVNRPAIEAALQDLLNAI